MAKATTIVGLEGEPLTAEDIKSIPILADAGIGDTAGKLLDQFVGSIVRRRFASGDVICHEGEGGNTAFVLLEGEVGVSIARRNERTKRGSFLAALGSLLGQKPVSATVHHDPSTLVPIDASVDLRYGDLVATLGPGEVVGEMSCLNLAPRSATCVAKSPVVALEMVRNIYEKLQSAPTFKARNDANYRSRALAGHLRNVPIFEGLPASAIDRLRASAELHTFKAGTPIVTEGDAADGMFLIRNGQVRVSKKMPGGELTLAYLTRGDFFGEIGLLRGTTRSTSCTAYDHPKDESGAYKKGTFQSKASSAELVKIKSAEFDWLVKEFPQIKARLEALAETRARATHEAQTQIVPTSYPKHVEDLGLLQGQGLLLIDLEKCTRCDQCVQACVASHDDGVTRLVREGPRYDKYLVPSRCRMCMDPLCMIGCPVGSIRRAPDLNMFIEDWCIGCGNCARQCPYNSIQMHDLTSLGMQDDPGVERAVRKDRAVVCDQCSTLPQGPACVYACPHDAAVRVNAREFFSLTVSASRAVLADSPA
ncbi:MAG: cyclic nucleotide-binding domain-containing protein [Phycisphaerae bacterium]|nr:cyclic nucleotide-binding domain-containing protein [Phycisphaerae bacterium]